MNDSVLIKSYLDQGDLAAAARLLSKYEQGLYRYLWKMLRHTQDSENALQETYRKALAALPAYREENHFKSWLYRIGHNNALDIIRKRKRGGETEEVSEEYLESRYEGPRETAMRRERAEELHSAVAQLPDSERAVVTLRLQEDLSFKQIAEIVNAPLGTVLARMHKAKERLRTQLGTA